MSNISSSIKKRKPSGTAAEENNAKRSTTSTPYHDLSVSPEDSLRRASPLGKTLQMAFSYNRVMLEQLKYNIFSSYIPVDEQISSVPEDLKKKLQDMIEADCLLVATLPNFRLQALKRLKSREEYYLSKAMNIFTAPQCVDDAVLINHGNGRIAITYGQFKTLQNGAWLIDEVIDAYIRLLNTRLLLLEGILIKHGCCAGLIKGICFNCQFHLLLKRDRELNDDKSLCYKLDNSLLNPFEYNRILIPINEDNVHWTTAVIDFEDEAIYYLDSLGNGNSTFACETVEHLIWWLKQKAAALSSKESIEIANRFQKRTPRGVLLQSNGFDCGVIMLQHIDILSHGCIPLHYLNHLTQEDSDCAIWRLHIGQSLLSNSLNYDYLFENDRHKYQ
jgi:hypothetical protein